MGASIAPAKAPLSGDDLRQMCEANPAGADGKRPNGTIDAHAADLRGAVFGWDLRDVDFHEANLDGAQFNDSNLAGADFADTTLRGAAMERAGGLHAAQLRRADLTGAFLPPEVAAFKG